MTSQFNDFFNSMAKGKLICSPDEHTAFTEGKNDVKDNVKYSNLFDSITDTLYELNPDQQINKSFKFTFYKFNIEIQSSDPNIPIIILNFDDRIKENGYNHQHNIMLLDAADSADEYMDALKTNDMHSISGIVSKYKIPFIHEMNHARDRHNNYSPEKLPANYEKEKEDVLTKLFGNIQMFLAKETFQEDRDNIDYLNKQTEYNSHALQYIWLCIKEFTENKNVNISFRQFIEPFIDTTKYPYLTENIKRRIIKRLYYVWEYIRKLSSMIKSLDNETVESIHNNILNLQENYDPYITNQITDIQADIAIKIILNESATMTKQENIIKLGLARKWCAINYDNNQWDLNYDNFIF